MAYFSSFIRLPSNKSVRKVRIKTKHPAHVSSFGCSLGVRIVYIEEKKKERSNSTIKMIRSGSKAYEHRCDFGNIKYILIIKNNYPFECAHDLPSYHQLLLAVFQCHRIQLLFHYFVYIAAKSKPVLIGICDRYICIYVRWQIVTATNKSLSNQIHETHSPTNAVRI